MSATANPQATAADPGVNAFVMANAGSGKTTTLVARVARLLLRGSPPSAVLCLTFTKAAAAEMQRRLYQRLGQWAVAEDEDLRGRLAELEQQDAAAYDAEDLARARRLFARALETPGGLKIQTIHAFCEQLLRRFPIEARVSPTFRVIDDAEAAAIRATAREAVARAALMNDPPVVADAYAALAGALAHADFEALFDRFEARRDALSAYVASVGGPTGLPGALARAVGLDGWVDPEAVEADMVAAIDPAAWFAAARVLAGGKATDQKNSQAMQAVAEAVSQGEVETIVAAVIAIFFTDKGEPRKSMATKSIDDDTGFWLIEEQTRLAEAVHTARAARVAANTLNVLLLAEVYGQAYAKAKAATGALDFADLISRTRDLLTDGPGAAWVLFKLDGGVDHLLVDEAQDTSPEQWDIVRALTEEFFRGEGAHEAGRRGDIERTVFVVGDEKQSIFSFQGAAPERLLRESQLYRQMVQGAGRRFETVELLQSWRSTPEVLAYVDRVFGTAERAGALSPGRGLLDDRVDAVVQHEAARTDGLPGIIDLWPVQVDAPAADRKAWDEPMDATERGGARRRLAERLTAEIGAMIDRGEAVHDPKTRSLRAVEWGDVLVLVKKRGPMFEEMLRALKRFGAPVAGADRLKLADHPVFEDLRALARTALFPGDDLSLAGVLRSPLCDVSEERLFEVAHKRPGRLWPSLRDRAGEADFGDAADLIGGFRAAAGRATPFDLFSGLMERRDRRGLTVRQRFLTRLGSEAADAIDAFLAQALAAEQRGSRDLERFAADLDRLDQTVKREMDEPRGEVRVMTAHSAKGLEAPVVILPDTIFQDPLGDALLEIEGGGFLWCGSKKDDCAVTATAREARKKKGEEESLRLLYVGLTRARDRLILGGRINARTDIDKVEAWWGPATQAMQTLGREVQKDDLTIRRFGPDPVTASRAQPAATETAAPPVWLLAPPEAEAGVRLLAPSQAEAESTGRTRPPALSPLARQATEAGAAMGRFRRGDLIHRLLERLPDLPPADWDTAAVRLLARERDLSDDQRAEMIAAALSVLRDARFAPVFGPGSRAEAGVVGPFRGRTVSGRIDRLVVTPDRVLIVDYKTNRPAPDRLEDVDLAYIIQLAVYAEVLKGAWPGRAVEAALVWTDGPKLTHVPAEAMAASLLQ